MNMRAPDYLLKRGVSALPCIGDGRQSGTSGSPSILNASPEAAAGGGLALLKTGDRLRVDLSTGEVNILLPVEELQKRATDLEAAGGYPLRDSQSPWQQYFRELTGQLSDGMVLRDASNYQKIAAKHRPRHNH